MKYIIADFEWNQPTNADRLITSPFPFDSEIIEIGAVRLSDSFEYEDEFKLFIRPQFYPVMNGAVAGLTKIRKRDLENAPSFPEAYRLFAAWCGDDCCLCTWGPDDVPVLMDNVLMHGLDVPDCFVSCDIQRVFGNETMRDNRQWSLEKAIDLLGLTKERSHDALNDVRNTWQICNRVDIFPFVDDYINIHINYERDRYSGVLSGKSYQRIEDVMEDEAMNSLVCPYCGEQVFLEPWLRESKRNSVSYACCGEGDAFLARFHSRLSRGKARLRISRRIFEMTDLLWDDYQTLLEQSEPVGISWDSAIAC